MSNIDRYITYYKQYVREGADPWEIGEYLRDGAMSIEDMLQILQGVFDVASPVHLLNDVGDDASLQQLLERNHETVVQVLTLTRIAEAALPTQFAPEDDRRAPTAQEIDALSARLGVPIPAELRLWLRLYNGSPGPGSFFRVDASHGLSIEDSMRWHAAWRENAWLPIASDGCGSYYVLAVNSQTRSGHPVLFLDHESSREEVCDTPTYVMASGLWPFLRLHLLTTWKLLDWHWPFDKQHTLQADPAIPECTVAPLPWGLG